MPDGIRMLQLVGTNYQATLLKYVDRENLPEYLGGTSKATLLDDVGPWQDQAIVDEIEADRRNALSQDVEADSTRGEALPQLLQTTSFAHRLRIPGWKAI